jgi:signal transduction histidine kinase
VSNSSSKPIRDFFVTLLVFTAITGSIAMFGILSDPAHEEMMLGGVFVVSFIFTGSVLGLSMPAWLLLCRHSVPDRLKTIALHVAVVLVVMLIGFAIGNTLVMLFMERIAKQEWGPQDVALSFLITVIGTLGANLAYYGNYFHQRSVEARKQALTAQMGQLKAQINPHFLFNSLNTIASLARTAPEKAEAVTEDLAEMFRYSLQSGELDTVPLRDELAAIRLYIAIETARFGERLVWREDIPDAVLHTPVPAFIVQPLVENAVKHGLGRSDAPCAITLRASRAEGRLMLRVSDTGPGFDSLDPEVVLTRGIGLANVSKRLAAQYGAAAVFRLHPDGVEIGIPAP